MVDKQVDKEVDRDVDREVDREVKSKVDKETHPVKGIRDMGSWYNLELLITSGSPSNFVTTLRQKC